MTILKYLKRILRQMPMSPTLQIIKSNLYKIAYLENLTLRITVENVYKILFSENRNISENITKPYFLLVMTPTTSPGARQQAVSRSTQTTNYVEQLLSFRVN